MHRRIFYPVCFCCIGHSKEPTLRMRNRLRAACHHACHGGPQGSRPVHARRVDQGGRGRQPEAGFRVLDGGQENPQVRLCQQKRLWKHETCKYWNIFPRSAESRFRQGTTGGKTLVGGWPSTRVYFCCSRVYCGTRNHPLLVYNRITVWPERGDTHFNTCLGVAKEQ